MSLQYVGYRSGQRLERFSFDKISEVLQQPDVFVWLDVSNPSSRDLVQIQEEFGLHELAIEDASTAHQRPKLEEFGETLFMTLHTAKPGAPETIYGELHVFVSRQFVILVEHGEVTNFNRVRERCESSVTLFSKGPGFVLYALLDQMVDQIMVVASDYQRQLDELEEDIFVSRVDGPVIERIYELKREVARLHDAVFPIAGMCSALGRLHREFFPKELRPYFRDVQDHVMLITRSMSMLRDALSDAMQVNLALVTVRQNEVVKRLAGWGAILAIPTMVFSLYGMNFDNMPELHSAYGYPVSMGATLIACLLLYRRLTKAGWL